MQQLNNLQNQMASLQSDVFTIQDVGGPVGGAASG